MLTDKEIERLNNLYDQAVGNYLNKTDFNPADWLEEEESLEISELIAKEDEWLQEK